MLAGKMDCSLYYYMAKEIVKMGDSDKGSTRLRDCLQRGVDEGLKLYGRDNAYLNGMSHFGRSFYLTAFSATPEAEIRSTGYVVDSHRRPIYRENFTPPKNQKTSI